MAKISTYPSVSPIKLTDKLIGTETTNNDATKNFLVSDLLSLSIANIQAYSLITQQHTTINTNKNVEFEFLSFSDTVTVSSNAINFNETGKFMIDVSVRAEHSSGGGDAQVSMWLKYPSPNVSNSRQVYTIANSHIQNLSYSFVVNIANASDTIFVQWATSNLNLRFVPVLATGIYPTAPSAVLSVYKIG
jgi:hypothetical protein